MKAVTDEGAGGLEEARAWTNPAFRRLWFGSAVSMFGSEISELAIPLLAIMSLSASASELVVLPINTAV